MMSLENTIENLTEAMNRLAAAIEGAGQVHTPDAKPEKVTKPKTTKPKADPEPEPAPEMVTDSEQDDEVDYAQVKAAVGEAVTEKGREHVKAVLDKFGAAKATELDAQDYLAFIKALK